VNEEWNTIKVMYIEGFEDLLRKAEKNRKEWLTNDTWKETEERRQLKAEVDQ